MSRPRIKAKPGTNAFTQEFARLTRDRSVEAKSESVGWLINEYLESGDYQKLAPSTRRDYERIIGVIEAIRAGTKRV